jgi:recombination protein RecT
MATQGKELAVQSIRNLLEKAKPQIAMALPRHITPDRMIRVALTSIQKTPKLLECDQISLLGCIVQAAQLGLEPDGITGFAYLVPFWNSTKKITEVQLIPGYKGLMNLARRSGEIGAIEARVVYQKDQFDYAFGIKPKLYHVPYHAPDAGEVTHVYAIAHFKDGSMPQYDVMTIEGINKIRNRSKAKTAGPWVTDFEEMAKKTVIRRLLKYAPTSVEVQKAIALDERADAGIPQDMSAIVDVTNLGEEAKPQEVKATELFKNGDMVGDAQEPA